MAGGDLNDDGFDDLLTGPTAIAFINGDVVEAAKGLRDFAKANPALVIKGGVLDGKSLDASEVAKKTAPLAFGVAGRVEGQPVEVDFAPAHADRERPCRGREDGHAAWTTTTSRTR